MAFVVPDKFLENYACSVCGKFLSVTPIKMFPNGKIKCGRCTTTDGFGTYSMFQIFAENGLFKCINKFDGCGSLLASNQVKKHEKKCKSKKYHCPICVESAKIPSFRVIQHFEEYHKNNILEKPYFYLNIEEALSIKKTFLHKAKDYLFFITANYNSPSDVIALHIVLLREEGILNILEKLIVHTGSIVAEKELLHLEKQNETGVTFPKTFDNKLLFVILELNLEEKLIVNIEKAQYNNLMNFMERKTVLSLQRKLYVEEDLVTTEHQKISVLGSTRLAKHEEVVLFCYVCSEIFTGSTLKAYNNNVHWSIDEEFQYVCSQCTEYFQTVLYGILSTHGPFGYDVFNSVLYYCAWNCQLALPNTELLEHEMTCPVQPKQECPDDDCLFTGRLYEIKQHFKINHKSPWSSLHFKSYIEDITSITSCCSIILFINGYFVHLRYILLDKQKFDKLVPHSGFCINNIDVQFCKKKPPNLKIQCFFYPDIKIPFKLTKDYLGDDGTSYRKKFLLQDDHGDFCSNSEKKSLKICLVPK